jgi:hypothetical protein
MRPDLYDSEKLDSAYKTFLRKPGKTGVTQAAHKQLLMAEIASRSQAMRDGGIPVHVPIRRRHTDGSSVYWGWPHNAKS